MDESGNSGYHSKRGLKMEQTVIDMFRTALQDKLGSHLKEL